MADDEEVIALDDAKRKRQSTRGSAYRAPSMPAVRVLSDAHRAHLRDTSALSDDTIALAELYTIDSRNEVIDLLGRVSNLPRGSMLVFPSFLPGSSTPYAYRVRPDEPRMRERKGREPYRVKYDQASAVGLIVYYPPRARSSGAFRSSKVLFWTEGEKKALLLDQLGFPCIGLTGVWNWSDPEARKAHAWALLPRIREHTQIAGVEHVIVFDRDARENRDVRDAMRQLARTLRSAGAKAVYVVLPPEHTEAKGIDDYAVLAGEAAVRELLEFRPAEYATHDEPPRDPQVVTLASLPALEGAPLPETLRVPEGYDVDSSGRVWLAQKQVLPRVMVVTRRSTDLATGEVWCDVVFHAGDRRGWLTLDVPRRALVDSRSMAQHLMARGAPVGSGVARAAAEWFLALELANALTLETTQSAASTGWVADEAFLLDELVYANEPPPVTPSAQLQPLVRALRPRGHVHAHEAALRSAWATSPVLRVAICAALAAPLLAPFERRSFALHLCGDSSRGKTTILRIAASVFGDPRDPSWVASWSSTAAALEVRAAALTDLPLCFDESGVLSAEELRRNVYALINGEGRSRGRREGGMRETLHWRTVVLSTGEQELAEQTGPTGAQARVINLLVDGFGVLDGDALAIDALAAACRDNSGWFGRRWVQWLVSTSAQERDDIRALLLDCQKDFIARAEQHQRRLADYAATMMLVERLLCQAFDFASEGDGVLAVLGGLSDAAEYERVRGAAEYMADAVEDWMSVNQGAFPVADLTSSGAFKVRARGAHAQRFGVRIIDAEERVTETLIVRSEFSALCRQHGRNASVVLRDWAALGWIATATQGGRRRLTVQRTEHRQPRQRWVVWLGREEREADDK